jgi:hypothetical protein
MTTASPSLVRAGYHELPLSELAPSALNPRRHVGDLTDLAASIREKGILEPVLVRPREGATPPYELVAGERRFRAGQISAALKLPAAVFEYRGEKALLKLTAAQLAQVMAVTAVAGHAGRYGNDKLLAECCDAFGVDLKAIDKAIAQEQAAFAKATPAAKTARGANAAKAGKGTTAGKAATRR